ncbi:MAG: prephenate dehydratase [Myxococcales bacterium]|nr:prephenate dehydratase [Myxococcales bacterium]
MSAPADLSALRARIEAIDHQLLALLAARLAIVDDVLAAKLAAASPVRDRGREELLLGRLRGQAVRLGLDPHEVERMYRVVLDMSVAHQEAAVRARADVPRRVAYQGVEGSYSHLAAQRRYGGRGGGALLTGHDSFRAAAAAVIDGAADLALLPIENSTAGSINETYDLLAHGPLTITGEVVSAVEHCLLALPGVALAQLTIVRSHPQALAQCHQFFAAHPHLRAVVDLDTAGAARAVRDAGDVTQAAIASAAAATTYGLAIVAATIQDERSNATRFVEVGLRPTPVPDATTAKTSLTFALADRPGALGEILSRIAARGLSLTKLESRPLRGTRWQYRFYLDLLGHAAGAAVQAVLAELGELTVELRVLGCYPAAEGPA